MNHLCVSTCEAIKALALKGWSGRRIARELAVNRETVARYLGPSKPAIPPPGSAPPPESNPAIPPLGSEDTGTGLAPEPAIPTAGSGSGRRSLCEVHLAEITLAIEQGLSAQRIYQDLVISHAFAGSYTSVKRFVHCRRSSQKLPFRRWESEPGEEAQIDFGQGAWVIDEQGKRRRPHLLRVILSHSRKGYSEVLWRQTTEEFIRGLENAFRSFGGVPAKLVVDNLRAAVSRCDWFEPELNPKVREFCAHYGTIMLPTRPAMPRHKGKVEAGVKYGQNNALKGHEFKSLAAQNAHLIEWERTVADTRLHGTTRRQVAQQFRDVERPRLQPLPDSLFPMFSEARRSVHRDGHIELQKAFYSVPPEFMGQQVWVRWESRLVRLFDERMKPIALHARVDPGRFSTDQAHIHSHKRAFIERGVDYMLDRAALMGKASGNWTRRMYEVRGVEGIRVLQGFLGLVDDHPIGLIERAAARALDQGSWRLRDLKTLLAQPSPQLTLGFLESHPLIRDLDQYAQLTPDCFSPL